MALILDHSIFEHSFVFFYKLNSCLRKMAEPERELLFKMKNSKIYNKMENFPVFDIIHIKYKYW